MSKLQIGLSAYDLPAADFLSLARAADQAGVHSLWLGEHVFHPKVYTSVHPGSHQTQHHTGPLVQEHTHLLDPLTTLAAAAAVTSRIRLATGIFVLPLRDPVLVSRALLTLDEISAGRFTLGAGAGWLAEEFAALGIDFEHRGRRTRESIAVIRACLGGGFVGRQGKIFAFDELLMTEEPVHVPVILGGNGEVALKRAAAVADGWFSSGSLTLEEAARLRGRMLTHLEERGRSEADFEMIIRPERAETDEIASFVDLGYRHVVVWADQVWDPRDTFEQQVRGIEAFVNNLESSTT